MGQAHAGSFHGRHNVLSGCLSFRPRSCRPSYPNDSSPNAEPASVPRHSNQSDEAEHFQSNYVYEKHAQLPENDGHWSSPMAVECTPKKAGRCHNYRRWSSPSRTLESIPSYRPSSLPTEIYQRICKGCDELNRRPRTKVSDLFSSRRRQTVSTSEGAQPSCIRRQSLEDNAGSTSPTVPKPNERHLRCKCPEADLSEAIKKVHLELASPTHQSALSSAPLQRHRASWVPEEQLTGIWKPGRKERSRSETDASGNPILPSPPRRSNEIILLGDLERRKSGAYARRAELNMRCMRLDHAYI